MRYVILILLSCAALYDLRSQDIDEFFKKADHFFIRYASNGDVNYDAIKDQWHHIEELRELIKDIRISKLDDATKKAFYINAYNIIAVYEATHSYNPQSESKPDITHILANKKHKIAGESMTLDRLESKKLHQEHEDPRVYFALYHSSHRGVLLAGFAYHPRYVDKQLHVRTHKAMNNDDWLLVNTEKESITISPMFNHDHFTARADNIIEFINKYRVKRIPEDYKIDYHKEDQGL